MTERAADAERLAHIRYCHELQRGMDEALPSFQHMETALATIARLEQERDAAPATSGEIHLSYDELDRTANAAAATPEPADWRPIAEAPLAVWGWAWNFGWRHAYPAMRNGNNGAVWVDTCEPEAKGWQTFASYWRPADLPAFAARDAALKAREEETR
jgi:hypothetical protein